jgi:ABC-2 type transport system ATP-binding protein
MAVKRVIGYLPEGAPAYPDMTPESYLRFVAEVRGFDRAERTHRVGEVAEKVSLRGVMRQPIETLSKGYKRRVGLAQALLHDPDALILDEPTDGLDPNQKHEVRELIRSLGGLADATRGVGKSIVLSTHILEEVEAVCTRVVVIARGRIVADSTPDDLVQRSRLHNAVRIRLRGSVDGVEGALRSISGVSGVERHDARELLVLSKNGKPIITDVGEVLRAKGADAEEVRVEHGRLDEVFRELTTGKEAAA